jgi:hypothetical protein
MLDFPSNTRQLCQTTRTFRRIDHQHPLSAIRNRGSKIHRNRRRADATPGPSNNNHWYLRRRSARFNVPRHQ